jgi:hypothetical protein
MHHCLQYVIIPETLAGADFAGFLVDAAQHSAVGTFTACCALYNSSGVPAQKQKQQIYRVNLCNQFTVLPQVLTGEEDELEMTMQSTAPKKRKSDEAPGATVMDAETEEQQSTTQSTGPKKRKSDEALGASDVETEEEGSTIHSTTQKKNKSDEASATLDAETEHKKQQSDYPERAKLDTMNTGIKNSELVKKPQIRFLVSSISTFV